MASTLLEPELDDKDALFQKLLLNAAAEDPSLLSSIQQQGGIPTTQVVPVPGFCLKTKNNKNEKVFVNICMAENVPPPKDLSDDELIQLLESDDPTGFRIPMSIGEAHAELDKSGQGCTAYDVVVNPQFMEKMKSSELFKTFFLTVMMEGLEQKYDTEISRDWVILKNRKFVGTLLQQNVRTQSKPFIQEMDGPNTEVSPSGRKKPGLIQEVDTSKEDIRSNKLPEVPEYAKMQFHMMALLDVLGKIAWEYHLSVKQMDPDQARHFVGPDLGPNCLQRSSADSTRRGKEPDYRIVQEPPTGHPEFLVAEITLPQCKTMSSLSLDLGEDRILLQTRSNIYYLDIYIPYFIEQKDCGAQFNRKTRILTITMPVQEKT